MALYYKLEENWETTFYTENTTLHITGLKEPNSSCIKHDFSKHVLVELIDNESSTGEVWEKLGILKNKLIMHKRLTLDPHRLKCRRAIIVCITSEAAANLVARLNERLKSEQICAVVIEDLIENMRSFENRIPNYGDVRTQGKLVYVSNLIQMREQSEFIQYLHDKFSPFGSILSVLMSTPNNGPVLAEAAIRFAYLSEAFAAEIALDECVVDEKKLHVKMQHNVILSQCDLRVRLRVGVRKHQINVLRYSTCSPTDDLSIQSDSADMSSEYGSGFLSVSTERNSSEFSFPNHDFDEHSSSESDGMEFVEYAAENNPKYFQNIGINDIRSSFVQSMIHFNYLSDGELIFEREIPCFTNETNTSMGVYNDCIPDGLSYFDSSDYRHVPVKREQSIPYESENLLVFDPDCEDMNVSINDAQYYNDFEQRDCKVFPDYISYPGAESFSTATDNISLQTLINENVPDSNQLQTNIKHEDRDVKPTLALNRVLNYGITRSKSKQNNHLDKMPSVNAGQTNVNTINESSAHSISESLNDKSQDTNKSNVSTETTNKNSCFEKSVTFKNGSSHRVSSNVEPVKLGRSTYTSDNSVVSDENQREMHGQNGSDLHHCTVFPAFISNADVDSFSTTNNNGLQETQIAENILKSNPLQTCNIKHENGHDEKPLVSKTPYGVITRSKSKLNKDSMSKMSKVRANQPNKLNNSGSFNDQSAEEPGTSGEAHDCFKVRKSLKYRSSQRVTSRIKAVELGQSASSTSGENQREMQDQRGSDFERNDCRLFPASTSDAKIHSLSPASDNILVQMPINVENISQSNQFQTRCIKNENYHDANPALGSKAILNSGVITRSKSKQNECLNVMPKINANRSIGQSTSSTSDNLVVSDENQREMQDQKGSDFELNCQLFPASTSDAEIHSLSPVTGNTLVQMPINVENISESNQFQTCCIKNENYHDANPALGSKAILNCGVITRSKSKQNECLNVMSKINVSGSIEQTADKSSTSFSESLGDNSRNSVSSTSLLKRKLPSKRSINTHYTCPSEGQPSIDSTVSDMHTITPPIIAQSCKESILPSCNSVAAKKLPKKVKLNAPYLNGVDSNVKPVQSFSKTAKYEGAYGSCSPIKQWLKNHLQQLINNRRTSEENPPKIMFPALENDVQMTIGCSHMICDNCYPSALDLLLC